MPSKTGGFTDAAARARYEQVYDAFVAEHWPVTHEELDVATSWGSTRVRRSGPVAGPPLVLLHSAAGSSASWYRCVESWARVRPVLAVDTIGCAGRSTSSRPIGSTADLVSWFDELMDAMAVDAAHVAGYSQGGWLAGCIATGTARPDRLRSLTLIEPAAVIVSMRRRTVAKMIGSGVGIIRTKDDGERRRRLARFNAWFSPGVEMTDDEMSLVIAAMSGFRERLPFPRRLSDEALASITCPTLVLLAEQSVVSSAAKAAARVRSVIPAARVEVVPGTGHGLPFERTDLVTSLVDEFVSGVPA